MHKKQERRKKVNRQAWHEWRSQGIGASDAPSIMRVSPWKSYYELWKEKVTGISGQVENADMRRGKALESKAIQFFEMEKGILLEEQVCLEHPTLGWMRATLDGMNQEEKVLVEVKTSRKLHYEVPEHYYPQLQHQMVVTGYKKMFYVIYDGKNGHIIEVERDDAYVKDLIEQEQEFWRLVQTQEAPFLEEKDFVAMENNPDWIDLAARYHEVKYLQDELEEEKKFLETQFILFSEGKNARGNGVTLTQIIRKGSVDYKSIPEIQAVDLEQYRKAPSNYWRITAEKKSAG